MKLVVGLGNPGARYAKNRHNVGFLVATRVAERAGAPVDRKLFGALVGDVNVADQRAVVAMPQQFMNLSGHATVSLMGFYKVPAADVILVHDDMDLPFGRLRVRVGGGHGGHNGVRDIQRACPQDMVRVRVGVGRPPPEWDAADYVLANWTPQESEQLQGVVDHAADAVHAVIADGTTSAMNRFNTRTT